MINVLFCANYKIDCTGIMSTAVNLLKYWDLDTYKIFSDQNIVVCGKSSISLDNVSCSNSSKCLIFTHLEYSGLPDLILKFPDAIVHVGDWQAIYWKSYSNYGSTLKSYVGLIRFFYRIRKIPKFTKLVFVNNDDTNAAINAGFKMSNTLPIGVNLPSIKIRQNIQFDKIFFTGNFNYTPNMDAAKQLIKWAQEHEEYKVFFVGYGAQLLNINILSSNIFLFDSVSNIIDFLAEERPIYVSLLQFGAGAKNKILEALVAGCPIIATPSSLDSYTRKVSTVIEIKNKSILSSKLSNLKNDFVVINKLTAHAAAKVGIERSWKISSFQLLEILND